jgi:hypothetical protein
MPAPRHDPGLDLKIPTIMRLASRNPADHDVNFMIGGIVERAS